MSRGARTIVTALVIVLALMLYAWDPNPMRLWNLFMEMKG